MDKKLTSILLTDTNRSWYIGSKETKEVINGRLDIKTPTRISRCSRDINYRLKWKGTEWRNWILYYAPIVLRDLLPERDYVLLVKLSEATFLLHQHSISAEELDKADTLLREFVLGFTRLGSSNMMYNIHLLRHLSASVRDWGPATGYSGAIFEAWN